MRLLPLLAVVLVVGCDSRPSPTEVEAAIRMHLAYKIPVMLLPTDRNTTGFREGRKGHYALEILEVRVLEVEEPFRDTSSRPYGTYCRVRAYIDCWVARPGEERLRLSGETNLHLFEHTDGWSVTDP